MGLNFMRKILLLVLTANLFLGCKGTDLSDSISINSENTPTTPSQPEPEVDSTAPTLLGVITHAANDSATDRGTTAVWPAGADDVALSHYEIAIATDNSSGTCDANDFGTPLLDWIRVPDGTDFTGAGYQLVNGQNDGSNQAINLNLNGDQDYCTAVRAVDSSNNTSTAIYSSAPWKFYYDSCLSALNNQPGLSDGVYNIDPDGDGGDAQFGVFCDMTTQGGGWTLVIRYDANQGSAGGFSLPMNAGRTAINIADLSSINGTGNLAASTSMIPLIQNGATTLMHVGKPDDAVTDSSTYARVYFSDIYQAVLDTPTNIFDSALDSNNGAGTIGAVVNGMDATRKDRWYESDMSLMTAFDTTGSTSNSYRIDGGEGNAMFNNSSREGAVYCSGATSNTQGHGDPKVQWGFFGADGSNQSYGGTIYVGTHCNSSLACPPENPINMMFVR